MALKREWVGWLIAILVAAVTGVWIGALMF